MRFNAPVIAGASDTRRPPPAQGQPDLEGRPVDAGLATVLRVGHPQRTIANDLKLIANIPDILRLWRPLIFDGPLSDASKSLDHCRTP